MCYMDLQNGRVYFYGSDFTRNYYIPIHSQGEGNQIDAVLFKYINKFESGTTWKHTYIDALFFAKLLPAPLAMQVLYGQP
jgi:hypothetical protein